MFNKYLFTKLVIIYIALTHIIPGIFYEALEIKVTRDYYYEVAFSYWIILPCLIVIAWAFILDSIGQKKQLGTKEVINIDFLSKITRAVSIFAFLFGIYAFLYLDRGFRYGDRGISESDTFLLTMILSTIPSILVIIIFYNIFIGNIFNKIHWAYKYIFIFSFFLNANGNASMLSGFIALVSLLMPRLTNYLFFNNSTKVSWLSLIKIPISVFMLITTIYFARIFGENIKRNTDQFKIHEDLLLSDSTGQTAFMEWLITRTAIYYVSTKTAIYYLTTNINYFPFQDYIGGFFDNIKFRLSRLLGDKSAHKPVFSSASFVNYYWITPNLREREGTAPGLIAGFLYYFPTPFNLIVLCGYMALIYKLISKYIILLKKPLSSIGLIFFLYWIFPFFESPIDNFALFDNSAVQLLFFLILAFNTKKIKVSQNNSTPDQITGLAMHTI